jgi:hypothetical protein
MCAAPRSAAVPVREREVFRFGHDELKDAEYARASCASSYRPFSSAST